MNSTIGKLAIQMKSQFYLFLRPKLICHEFFLSCTASVAFLDAFTLWVPCSVFESDRFVTQGFYLGPRPS